MFNPELYLFCICFANLCLFHISILAFVTIHSLFILALSPPDLFLLTAQPLIEHVSYLFHDKISSRYRGGGIAAKLHPEPIILIPSVSRTIPVNLFIFKM